MKNFLNSFLTAVTISIGFFSVSNPAFAAPMTQKEMFTLIGGTYGPLRPALSDFYTELGNVPQVRIMEEADALPRGPKSGRPTELYQQDQKIMIQTAFVDGEIGGVR